MLSVEILKRLYPSANQANVEIFAAQCGSLFESFGISATRNRLHFFLAQLGHESGGLKVREENMNYSAERLRVVWPSRFPTIASTNGFAHNPEALANKVYGGRMGNDRPGDGWKYRGRGYIQITGKDGYRNVGDGAGLDLVADPGLAIDPRHCLKIACAFWKWKKINPICDRGDFVAVTKRINGGTVGMQDRFEWLERVQSIVDVPVSGTTDAHELALPIVRLKAIQVKLKDLGLYEGSIDGIFGKNSRAGLKIFQADNGLPKTGRITRETLDKLGV